MLRPFFIMQLSVIKEVQPDFTGDFYTILGVSKRAKLQAIKDAYRRLASRFHPDRAVDMPKEEARAKFELIQKAYETLSDPKKRAFYDDTGVTVADPNLLEKNATVLVTGRLLDICNNLCSDSNSMTPIQLAKTDIVASATESFRIDLRNNYRAQESIRKVIAKLEVVVKRLSRRKFKFEAMEVGTLLLKQLKSARATLGEAQNAVFVLERAMVLIKDYKYKVEVDPPPPVYRAAVQPQPAPTKFHLE